MKYSIDTSALMDAWVRYYPPDVFKSLWLRIDGLISQSHLCAIEVVREELEKKSDDLHKWVTLRPQMFMPLDEMVQGQAFAIINNFPSLANPNTVMGGKADPFVIALAKAKELIVVTAEKSKPSNPRIPDVCEKLELPCMKLVEMFRKEGWEV